MIKRVEGKNKFARYDPKSKQYVCYRIDVRVNGKRLRSAFPTRKDAQDFIDAARSRQKNKRAGIKSVVRSPRVSELFAARLKEIKSKHEYARVERVFKFFQDLIGDPKVTEVSRGDFQLFINNRTGVKLETINRELNPLSKAFRSAPQLFPKELEDYEPPRVPRPKFKRTRREKIISTKEKDAILKHLYASQGDETVAEYENRIRIGRMFHLAYLLGMAYKEVATLKKSSYNGELIFIRHKTGNEVKFEWLPDEAHQVIKAAIASSGSDYIFTHTGSTPKDFYKVMRSAVEAVGLVYGRENGITFHSARHSFVTAAMAHTDLKTVGSMSGHSDETMVMLYTHATPESRKKALQSMYGKADLKEIFEKVRSGKMSFEEFEKLVS